MRTIVRNEMSDLFMTAILLNFGRIGTPQTGTMAGHRSSTRLSKWRLVVKASLWQFASQTHNFISRAGEPAQIASNGEALLSCLIRAQTTAAREISTKTGFGDIYDWDAAMKIGNK
jgi:hypothetical protein